MVARLSSLLVVVVLALGCSSSSGGSGSATTAPSVDDVLARAATTMGEVTSARFRIERTGAPAHLDDAGLLAFESAEGAFAAPSSTEAVVQVTAGGLRTRVGAVAIDGEVWITNPVTGRWEPAPPGLAFDPARLFDPRSGWPRLLSEGLADAELVPGGGADRHHVRGAVGAEHVAGVTGGLVDEATEVELWIDAASGHVVELRFDTAGQGGTTSWQLLLDGYGEPVSVERPPLEGAG